MDNQLTNVTKQFEGTGVEIIINKDGEPLFELYSTGSALGYSRWTESKGKKYFKIEKSRIEKITENADIKGLAHDGQTYLTEEMLYDFMLEARTKKCKKFRKWVTKKVLPSIRKHGAYLTPKKVEEVLLNPDTIIKLATQIKEEQNKNKLLTSENKALSKDIISWADESVINAIVRKYGANKQNNFGGAWIEFKKCLLYGYSINLNARITHYLNENNVKTKPKTLSMLKGKEELTMALKTAIAMCKDENINIEDILEKHLKENN